ncbi:MAG: hypothetical protein H7A33_07890 [Deltaproteobacteria bacterium]|nr:hypothetical protein [Deltaproteobacteria bacterium]
MINKVFFDRAWKRTHNAEKGHKNNIKDPSEQLQTSEASVELGANYYRDRRNTLEQIIQHKEKDQKNNHKKKTNLIWLSSSQLKQWIRERLTHSNSII